MTLNMNIKIIAPFRQFLFFAVPVFLFFLLGVFSYLPMLGWIAAWILLLIFSIFNNFSALFIEKFATYAFTSLLFLGGFLGHDLHLAATCGVPRCAETVCAVVGEIGFTCCKQIGNSCFEVVIYPNAAHSIVYSGINTHWG